MQASLSHSPSVFFWHPLLDRSGQVVRGAPKDKDKQRPPGGVEDIFEGARAAGAEQGSYEDMMEDEEGGQRFRAFSGAGRTLAGAPG